jgi:large-conductance mechanosensitive channel
MKVEKTREEIRKYRLAIVKQMLQLATAGFGLVAALAWNELIKAFIEDFIKPRVSVGSGIISLALYALIVTALAVFVTLQLSKLAEKMEKEE